MKGLSLTVVLMYLFSVAAYAQEPVDRKFVSEAAAAGMAEIELSKLASQKASSDAVKQYAEHVVQDHQQTNEKLKELASQKNIPLPTTMETGHKRAYEKLSKSSGAEFDREYVDAMIKDHKKTIKTFQNEAKNGKDPDLKAFAGQIEPTLQTHLGQAQQLEQQLKSGR